LFYLALATATLGTATLAPATLATATLAPVTLAPATLIPATLYKHFNKFTRLFGVTQSFFKLLFLPPYRSSLFHLQLVSPKKRA
jgi:hypothetical protein